MMFGCFEPRSQADDQTDPYNKYIFAKTVALLIRGRGDWVYQDWVPGGGKNKDCMKK